MQIMNFSSANCKNCYKCVRTCVVKAIQIKNDQAHIIEDRCVACGQCLVVCPQNARNVLSHVKDVKDKIEEGVEVIATLAPAYRGYFQESGKFVAALKQLGFSNIQETSIGAELVSREYEKIINTSNNREIITSCCPSVMMMIERYYPELIPNILHVVSPMIAHGKVIKSYSKEAFVVFIGPCFSKTCESMSEENLGIIDSVLTFDEVTSWIEDEGIKLDECNDDKPDNCGTLRGNRYPLVGGIIGSIRNTLDDNKIGVLRVHTMENCKTILEEIKNKNLSNICVELSACNESCLGGPGGINNFLSPYMRLQNLHSYVKELEKKINLKEKTRESYLEFPDIDISRKFSDKRFNEDMPTEAEIIKILEKMGKYNNEDELNCSACGYNTCREKAIAVHQGMSQVQVCLPNMRNKAERMSNKIFTHSPNAIIVLDSNLMIEEMNSSAEEAFLCKNFLMKGKSFNNIIDDDIFKEALINKTSRLKEKVVYSKYNYIAYRNIVYLEKQNALLIIFTDITEEEKRKNELAQLKQETLTLTQTIIDKQMRTVQEIASLLGESTAETKVAFTKLKKVLEEERKY